MVNAVAGRNTGSNHLDKVKAAIHQELLVLDICQEPQNKRYVVFCLLVLGSCGAYLPLKVLAYHF